MTREEIYEARQLIDKLQRFYLDEGISWQADNVIYRATEIFERLVAKEENAIPSVQDQHVTSKKDDTK